MLGGIQSHVFHTVGHSQFNSTATEMAATNIDGAPQQIDMKFSILVFFQL